MLSQTDGLGSVYGCNQSVLLLQSITETDICPPDTCEAVSQTHLMNLSLILDKMIGF